MHCSEQCPQGNNECFALAGVGSDGGQFVWHFYKNLKIAAKMKKAS
jgi:hypothetical protein